MFMDEIEQADSLSQAAQDADQSFFKKWANVGKKISKGKTGLSDKQIKLYKEAEKSVERGACTLALRAVVAHLNSCVAGR
jgi:hypothetical protein